MAFYSQEQLLSFGFKRLGKDVKLSDRTAIHNPGNIEIGDNTRIDDFCVLSAGGGGISIGRHVHIAVHSVVTGDAHIAIGDFAGLASRVSVLSSGRECPTEPLTEHAMDAVNAAVTIERLAIVGSGSVILPGVTLHEGSGVGALSLVLHDCKPFGIYFGIPAKRIGSRARSLLDLQQDFLAAQQAQPSVGA